MPLNIVKFAGKIHGVEFKQCKTFPDSRGSFTEVFRSEWPQDMHYGDEIQLNLSRSIRGSMRGLHFHHEQSDWWIPVTGILQIALADLREGSPTFMETLSFTLSSDDSACLLIPPGVAHGFLALEDTSLIYVVNRYYDGSDEQGVAWNDTDLNIQWAVSDPIRSERDRSNPTVKDLRSEGLLPVI
ncbi:MAG: dTDP-4-dehydrorhamnose 3,5-epimerase family protein [Candidatus Sabulitectum sp.]|nr:dTDP-4-dehydrorhamnose 3,5-epimerase family protein [Candidatus Sabulitectum sp.]